MHLKGSSGIVIKEEKGLRTTNQNVVDTHGNKIYANGIVLPDRLSDL
jgi:hypothetical protein